MSSFVISKQHYVRIAGYISGIANELNVWIYNYKDNRNFTKEDYLTLFKWVYDANAISVQKQYNDDTRENDTNDYMDDFNKYYKLGCKDCFHHNYTAMLNRIHSFFRSAKYQIEDDFYSTRVTNYFNLIFEAIYDRTIPSNDMNCWGSFEIESN